MLNYLLFIANIFSLCCLFELNLFCFLGKNFCMAQIEELCANPIAMHSSEQIQSIIMFLQRSEGLSKHVDSFMQMLSFVQQKDAAPSVLTPLLSHADPNFLGYDIFSLFMLKKFFSIYGHPPLSISFFWLQ